MGVRELVVGGALAICAALAPVPWWAGIAAPVLALAGAPWLGGAMIFGAAPWPWACALLLLMRGGNRWGLAAAVIGAGAVIAAKQLAVSGLLPDATIGLAALAATIVGSAVAVVAVEDRRGVWVAGAIVLGRLAMVYGAQGEARLDAALRLHAERLVYDSLLDSDVLPALVRAVPDRDEAALRLGWKEALDLGWYPQRADGVEVEVAQELERRGRGGIALRMLRRHPRAGAIDAWASLLEVTQGEPVRWKGATLGPLLSDHLVLDVGLYWDHYEEILFTVHEAVPGLILEGEGTSFEGPPSVRVRLDAEPESRWTVEGKATLALPGVAPGPHRIQLWFDTDKLGPGGDRGIRIAGLGVAR